MKIFINGLQKNDSEIMPDPPVKYLKNDKCDQMYRIFSTTFIYIFGIAYVTYDWFSTLFINKAKNKYSIYD